MPKGRGAASNPDVRFESTRKYLEDDGWGSLEAAVAPVRTELIVDSSRTVINYNDSPDVPFDRSINPYRGCEHGCVYCFARPTHAYLGYSPGLDFESRIHYKPDAIACLREELAKPGYRPRPISLGINTDAYQPVERKLQLTRRILEVLNECSHPVTIVTKSRLVERDLDILSEMAQRRLVTVALSITTLDHSLARTLEPRATAPRRRLQTIEALAEAGVPVGVMVAPLIPVLTDSEMETILSAARTAGACFAGYVLIRLPHEVHPLFEEWLQNHTPLKAAHVMNRIRDCRNGKAYNARFGDRMRGSGIYADLIAKRFHTALDKLGFSAERQPMPLDCSAFRPPGRGGQMSLF